MHGPHVPPRRTLEERVQSWARIVLPLVTVALLLYAGQALLGELRTTPLPTVSPLATPVALPLPPASPFVIEFPTSIEMVLLTPTLTIPTPEASPYQMLPTPKPVVCGSWTKKGDLCDMPKFNPTPTPYPECPTIEGKKCIATGKPEDGFATPRPVTSTSGY
jgi:hypothetical protein